MIFSPVEAMLETVEMDLPEIPPYREFKVKAIPALGFEAIVEGPKGVYHYSSAETPEAAMRGAWFQYLRYKYEGWQQS